MGKFVRRLFIAVAVLAIALGATASYLLQDPNRFKPQLEALIEKNSGVPLTIGGDLDWRLWPPVSLTAEDLSTDYQGQHWQIGRLTLDLDAVAAIRNPAEWRIQSLSIDDATMSQPGSRLTITQARLSDLVPDRPAPLRAHLSYAAEGQAPVPVDVDGQVTVDPQSQEITLRDTRIETPYAAGKCNASAQPTGNPAAAAPATEGDLIPVGVFRAYSWSGECALDWAELNGQRFEQVSVDLSNQAGDSAVIARIPQFFGGDAVADLAIDARATPVRWTLSPTLTGVDSTALMKWLNEPLDWVSHLAYGGTLTFEGNTAQALAASLSGQTRFDGGHGRIDIAAIRSQLLELATLFGEGDRIRRWPEMWDYQRFVGNWQVDHQHHQIEGNLDNLSLTAKGTYDPAKDDMNVLLTLVFGNDPSWPVFEMNPLLYDLPIPVRCQGSLQAPECKVDDKAAKRIVAAALGNENSPLRSKLEQKIDKELPAQYRDAARSLLDALGGGRKDGSKDD